MSTVEEGISAREQEINKEYRYWKKNTPFLYDTLVTKALDWPSLTCQWLPDVETREDKDYQIHRMILGTHTNAEEPNYLQIAEVQLPLPSVDIDTRKYDDITNEIGGYGGFNDAHIKITQKIVHEGEVNRARYQYNNPNIIATKSPSGDVYVFDRTTYASFPKENEAFQPALFLKGHSKEGYGLAWNPHGSHANHLLSAGFDGLICHWDIGLASQGHHDLEASAVYRGHAGPVEDVAWHFGLDTIFASVGDDKKLMIWDTRQSQRPMHDILAHEAEVNGVDFNKHNEYLLATGSGDKTAALWDLRNLKYKLHQLKHHQDEVFQIAWSPHDETILATASSDRRVMVWDLARMNDPKDDFGAPAELLFMHGGHTNKISDFNWHPGHPWTLASAAEDNVVQVWKIAASIYRQPNLPSPAEAMEE
ncbi:retinoblastoma-binding protein 4 [Hesseltinella vesiculosa]|uniref:Retinoblastoma-binding protein 4 n=1 Tax=Hesseltinella vesiculosa TaxID=101127 RepID=A0A1X2GML9_9FUNG|nr:retinoblastoma-binding protein 4 [Hesseltinella vesiculosa]